MDPGVLNAHSEDSNRSGRLSGRSEASLGAQSNCWFIATHRLGLCNQHSNKVNCYWY